jgi:hypothetical protein
MLDRGKLAFVLGTVALGLQGFAVWFNLDERTFGPQGPGTAFLKDVFGQHLHVPTYAQSLSEMAHSMLFVAISLLGSVFVWPLEEGEDDDDGVGTEPAGEEVEAKGGVLEVEE